MQASCQGFPQIAQLGRLAEYRIHRVVCFPR